MEETEDDYPAGTIPNNGDLFALERNRTVEARRVQYILPLNSSSEGKDGMLGRLRNPCPAEFTEFSAIHLDDEARLTVNNNVRPRFLSLSVLHLEIQFPRLPLLAPFHTDNLGPVSRK